MSGKKKVKLSMKKRQVPDRFLDQRERERTGGWGSVAVSLSGKGTRLPSAIVILNNSLSTFHAQGVSLF